VKTSIVIVFGVAALFCGLKAALLWRDSTNVPWLPAGFEPVDPDMRRAWSDVARYEQSNKAAKLAAATAVGGFVGVVTGLWPT
jgi:hypothetical protein